MMLISEISISETEVKITLSTGESLSLPYYVYNMYSLSRGKIVDSTAYQQLKEESDRYGCRIKALNYISIRSRSAFEIKNYLVRKGFSKETIESTIAELKEKNYLNDYEFAKMYINHKKKFRKAGAGLLKNELYKKGISRETVQKAISDTGAIKTDIEELYRLAIDKLKKLKNKKNKYSRLSFFLRQRGFGFGDIRTVIERLQSEEPEENIKGKYNVKS